jgi:endo-1,4-beta-xylanase
VISIFSTGLAESGNRANVSRLSSRDPCVNQGDRTIPAENYEKQAEVYKKLFEIFMRHEDVIDRVTFWGLSDTRAWRRNQHPLLFDGELNPKPAYKAVIEASMTK